MHNGLRCVSPDQVVIALDMSSSTTVITGYQEMFQKLIQATKETVGISTNVRLSIYRVTGRVELLRDEVNLRDCKDVEMRIAGGSALGDALFCGATKVIEGIQDGGKSCLILFADGDPRGDTYPYEEVKALLNDCRRFKVVIRFFAFITEYSRTSIANFIRQVGLLNTEVVILEGKIEDAPRRAETCFQQAQNTITRTILR